MTASEEMGAPDAREKGDPTKRAAILEAAMRLFFHKGYRAAGMEAIAREAGVSKQTVYAHFGSKESLFEAMIRAKVDSLLAPAENVMAAEGEPEAVLRAIAERFMEMVLDGEGMALFRVILAESRRFPDLAEAVYRSGPQRAADGLAAYLADADGKGLLRIGDAGEAARLFFAMLRGDLYMRALLGAGPDPSAAEVVRTVNSAVDTFLAAHGR